MDTFIFVFKKSSILNNLPGYGQYLYFPSITNFINYEHYKYIGIFKNKTMGNSFLYFKIMTIIKLKFNLFY